MKLRLFLAILTCCSTIFFLNVKVIAEEIVYVNSIDKKIYKLNLNTGDKIELFDFNADNVSFRSEGAQGNGNGQLNLHFVDTENAKIYLHEKGSLQYYIYDVINDTFTSTRDHDGNDLPTQRDDEFTSFFPLPTIAVKDSISTNTSNISTNTSNISTNTSNISTNTSNISTNTSNISTNTSNIARNTNAINNLSMDISGSVALSSALAALPNSSPDAFYTCGLGTGIHDSSSALSAGCASDFSNYAFADNLPKIFQTASFNIGSSFLVNGEPDISEARDMSIKAGITFKFGSVKRTRVANKQNHMLENKIDAIMQENRTLKAQLKEENDLIRQENDLLKAQIAEINTQLNALNMLAMN